jgi:hypothetical protein
MIQFLEQRGSYVFVHDFGGNDFGTTFFDGFKGYRNIFVERFFFGGDYALRGVFFFFFLSKPFVLASISIRIFVIWGLGYKCVSVRADGFGVPLLLFTLSRALERIHVVMREIPFFMKDVETNSSFFV